MPTRRTHFSMLLLCAAGCGNVDFLPTKANIDDEAAYELSILAQESCPLPEGLDAKKVTIYSYRVELVGNDAGGVPSNYFYASLITADGSRYLAGNQGCSPVLSGPPLRPGERAVGFLNFPVPPAKAPETLEFTPALLRSETGSPTRIALENLETLPVGKAR